jgi:hypothetical protein
MASRAWLLLVVTLAARGEDGYYAGQCTDGRALYFVVTKTGTNTGVSLHLEGAWSEPLNLKTNAGSWLSFGGGGEANEARWPVASLWLAATNSTAEGIGFLSLSGSTNGIPFTARRVAVQTGFSRKRGLHLWGFGGGKQFDATWPDFQDNAPFHNAVSKLLGAEARGESGRFTTGASGIVWESLKRGASSLDWEGLEDTEIVWLGTNLVSLLQMRYAFTGGAHGNSEALGRNFILAGGKAREFPLKDLFLPGTDWVGALSAACLRELRLQHASWVMPDAEPAFQVRGFSAEALASFNVDRTALFIHFDPYAVGPYVEGRFHVAIPWRELEGLLDPQGPAGQVR